MLCRELLNVYDAADAAIYLFEQDTGESPVNIGCGTDIDIRELVNEIKAIVGYNSDIIYDSAKPDGVPRKLLNNSLIDSLGWSSTISLNVGLIKTY